MDATRRSWRSMQTYGNVCERWQIFENFLEDMGEKPKDKQLRRLDNSKDYEPGNVFWTKSTSDISRKRLGKVREIFGCVNPHCGWEGGFFKSIIDFHHVNSKEKKFPLSRAGIRPPEEIVAELAKCVPVCANCHRLIHLEKLDPTNWPRCIITPEEFASLFHPAI